MNPQDCKPLPEKVNVLVNVFTYAKQVGADLLNYCVGTVGAMGAHKRIEIGTISYTQGYPTDRVRNAACAQAKRDGFHFLLMLDDDMKPDLLLNRDPDAVEFLPTALDFALAHDGPCLVGAPYCSTPPNQDVVVMKNRVYAPDLPVAEAGMKLDKYTRDEAAVLTGIKQVAALPTGCLLVDIRACDIVPPPWFSYEYEDEPFNTKLASTEDIVFTRNCDWLGVPNYCAWSSWAGHVKSFTTGKPELSPVTGVAGSIHKAWSNGWRPKEQPVS